MSKPIASQHVNLLDLKPVRLATWQERDGKVVVDRPPPPRPWKEPLEWLAILMSVKRIRLDDRGSELWRRLDGATSVKSIIKDLRKRFGEQIEPAEERVSKMLHSLQQERLISLTQEAVPHANVVPQSPSPDTGPPR